jgi:hypothetical protein
MAPPHPSYARARPARMMQGACSVALLGVLLTGAGCATRVAQPAVGSIGHPGVLASSVAGIADSVGWRLVNPPRGRRAIRSSNVDDRTWAPAPCRPTGPVANRLNALPLRDLRRDSVRRRQTRPLGGSSCAFPWRARIWFHTGYPAGGLLAGATRRP